MRTGFHKPYVHGAGLLVEHLQSLVPLFSISHASLPSRCRSNNQTQGSTDFSVTFRNKSYSYPSLSIQIIHAFWYPNLEPSPIATFEVGSAGSLWFSARLCSQVLVALAELRKLTLNVALEICRPNLDRFMCPSEKSYCKIPWFTISCPPADALELR